MRRAPAALGLALALLLAASGCTQEDETPSPRYRSYVALGDSYTSGSGIEPLAYAPCGRSAVNYPQLLAKALKIKDLDDASCGGATTRQLLEPHRYLGNVIAPPQADALAEKADLVTIGIGANNRGFSSLALLACLPGSPRVQACNHLLRATPEQVTALAAGVAEDVGGVLELIRDRAPEAEVVLVGYPSLGRSTCPTWGVTPAAVHQVNALLEALDEQLEEVAQEYDVRYVETFGPSLDHGICSDEPWVTGPRGVPGRGHLMHPLDTYHRAVAKLVEEALAD